MKIKEIKALGIRCIKKYFRIGLCFAVGASYANFSQAETCPMPPTRENPLLIPEPWVVFPNSREPQFEEGIQFVKAQIPPKAVSSINGIICTYHGPTLGDYSIWQPLLARKAMPNVPGVPTCMDYWFSDKRRGDVCSESLDKCTFIVSKVPV